MSVVLIREGRVQKLIFYVSKVLKRLEIRYLNIEKTSIRLVASYKEIQDVLERPSRSHYDRSTPKKNSLQM